MTELQAQERSLSRWRMTAFAVSVVALVILGLTFHQWTKDPGVADPFGQRNPLGLYFYASDPDVTLNVTVEVSALNGGSTADVSVSSSSTTQLAVLSTLPSYRPSGRGEPPAFRPLPRSHGGGLQYNYYHFMTSYLLDSRFRQGYPVGSFLLPGSTVEDSDQDVTIRLPTVGNEIDLLYSPVVGAVGDANTVDSLTAVLDLKLKPSYDVGSASPEAYTSRDTTQGLTAIYWRPQALSATEVVSDIGETLDNVSVLAANPSDYSYDQYKLSWTGSFGLNPFLYAEKRSAVSARGRWEFLSGVAFATAAAALVALIQEGPDKLPGLRRRRRKPAFEPVVTEAASSALNPDVDGPSATTSNPNYWGIGLALGLGALIGRALGRRK